ncbi:MAG: pitrilysin family protein [Bacteroidia bacterium]|nr:insulinase family protein [Bacteroidia bacterium]MDW8015505.1 pitrilysin family protein [Bacteroidia bacterium]
MTRWQLSNGLEVYLLPSESPFTAVVLAYRSGAAHEPPEAAGVAHLLEHLLFEDEEIAYDQKIQSVGGLSNAYTGQDYTIYHARLPRDKALLALELEAARLFALSLSSDKVAIQRQVVAEEFRQRYLNPPYADRFFHILEMLFPDHPYGKMVIGRSPEQVSTLPEEAVRRFYDHFYTPAHAVLCIAGGGIDEDMTRQIRLLYEHPKEGVPLPFIAPTEGLAFRERLRICHRPFIPQKAVFWAYRLPSLQAPITHGIDLLDDFLGEVRSGFLVQRLVHEEAVASRLHTIVWQMHHGGIWLIEAYLLDGVSIEEYEDKLRRALKELRETSLKQVLEIYRPLRYLALYRQRSKVLGQALALAHAVLAGHPEWYEAPLQPYEELNEEILRFIVHTYLDEERQVRLHYVPTDSST